MPSFRQVVCSFTFSYGAFRQFDALLRRPKTRFHQHGKTDHFQKSCSLRGSATLRDYVAISLGQVSHLFHHSLPVKKILSIEITAPNRAVFACKDGCRDRSFSFLLYEFYILLATPVDAAVVVWHDATSSFGVGLGLCLVRFLYTI